MNEQTQTKQGLGTRNWACCFHRHSGILVGRRLKEGGLLSIKPTKISQFKKFPIENQSEEKTGKKHKAPKQMTQFFFFFFFFLLFGHAASPQTRDHLCPLQWKHSVLTAGPPGKFQQTVLIFVSISFHSQNIFAPNKVTKISCFFFFSKYHPLPGTKLNLLQDYKVFDHSKMTVPKN